MFESVSYSYEFICMKYVLFSRWKWQRRSREIEEMHMYVKLIELKYTQWIIAVYVVYTVRYCISIYVLYIYMLYIYICVYIYVLYIYMS